MFKSPKAFQIINSQFNSPLSKSNHILQLCEQLHQYNKNIQCQQLQRVLYGIGLLPSDLIQKSRNQIRQQCSDQILKKWSHEEIMFYIEKKYQKLQLRRKKLIKEVLDKYEQIYGQKEQQEEVQENNNHFLTKIEFNQTQYTSKHSHKKYESQNEDYRYNYQQKRIDADRKLKDIQLSDLMFRKTHYKKYFQKLAAAQQRRKAYQSQYKSTKESPNKWVIKNKIKYKNNLKTEGQMIENFRQSLQNKLKKAFFNHQLKVKQLKKLYNIKNAKQKNKSQELGYKLELEQINSLQNLKKQIQQDLENHESKRIRIQKQKIEILKNRQKQLDQKINYIRENNQYLEQQQYLSKLKQLQDKDTAIQTNIKQRNQKIMQMINEKRYNEYMKLKQAERKRAETQLEIELQNKKINESRILVNSQVLERKKNMFIEKQKTHIIERINKQISQMNYRRQIEIQNRQVEEVEQNLQLVQIRYKKYMDRKKSMQQNREKMRRLFKRKREDLKMYFNIKEKDLVIKENKNVRDKINTSKNQNICKIQ